MGGSGPVWDGKPWQWTSGGLILAVLMLASLPSAAEPVFSSLGIREATSAKPNDQIELHALVLRLGETPLHKWLPKLDSLELGLGLANRHSRVAKFIAAGPVFRFEPGGTRGAWFVELGSQVCYFGDQLFSRREPGGHLQFASHLGVGLPFGPRRELTAILEYRHVSNAELQDTNFGADLVSMTLHYRLEQRLAKAR